MMRITKMRANIRPFFKLAVLMLVLCGSPAIVAAQTNAATPVMADKSAAGELAYWNSIKNSTNEADFKTYLANFPNGMFYDQAIAKFEQAGGKASELSVSPPAKGAVTQQSTMAVVSKTKPVVKPAPQHAVIIAKVKPKSVIVRKSVPNSQFVYKSPKPKALYCRRGYYVSGYKCIAAIPVKKATKKVVKYSPPPFFFRGGGGGGGGGGGWGG